MSAPSSPLSERSDVFAVDHKIVKMIICFVERRFFTNLTSSGPPTDMGGKYSLRCSALTASRTYFAIRAAFARRGTIMLKYRYFGALKGTYVPAAYYPRRRKSSNARRTATVRLEIGTGRQ
ncbi:uncharacterized protein HD556DRAFT_1307371 [Suillus plorans]|uniref:Uncharacterized protein n=1 Tax=Suillus plorans TaxID=116603 RepID=A0A9P7ASM7_9AGAM|nr:uncharacterized protein HD556DRAFT_1307371 [Suillus plorans]KAG1795687.1 hypothetical protein HD556DRAFT_1307371 [Suillus plorans]